MYIWYPGPLSNHFQEIVKEAAGIIMGGIMASPEDGASINCQLDGSIFPTVIVSYISNVPQDEIGTDLGLYFGAMWRVDMRFVSGDSIVARVPERDDFVIIIWRIIQIHGRYFNTTLEIRCVGMPS